MLALRLGVGFCIMYAMAQSPTSIYFGAIMASGAQMLFATTSSIMTFNVEKHEFGSIQGALHSLQSISQAMGPLLLNYIYSLTVNGAFLGAGSLFYVSSFIYLVAALSAIALPPEQSNSKRFLESESLERLLDEEAFGNVETERD